MSNGKPTVVRPPKQFDLSRFETMVEPFSVRVDKIKGTMKYEIPMPPSDNGGAAGTGWSKDQVRDIQTWLVNEWSGGGHYNIAITDASAPSQMMEWTAYYPITEFPEKMPPTLQGAFLPNFPQPQQVKPTMATFPGSGATLPPASLYPQQPGLQPMMPAPQPTYYPAPVPYGYATPMGGGGASNEAAMLREQLARAREEAVQRDFERRLAEMKAESDRRFVELQQSMSAMVTQMTQALKEQHKPIDANAIAQADNVRRLEEQLRAQTAEMERVRREAEMRDEIRRTQEATGKLVEESNRRFEAFMAANASKGPDPQLMMFQQMFASQMEAMKELARSSQGQLDRVQNFMMRPQDVLAIAKESSTNTDQIVHNLARQYEQMFSMSRQLTEQAAQLNQGGGGNEVIGLVRDVGANLAEMAQKYTGNKSKEAVAQMNAQAEVARAQADVQKAQLEQMARMAALEAAIKSGAVVQMPDGTFRAPGATVPQMPAATPIPPTSPNTRPWMPQRAPVAPVAAAPEPVPVNGLNGAVQVNGAPNGGVPNNVVSIMTGDTQTRRMKGRTDVEWFGPILVNVNQLRGEVAAFLAALEENPPREAGADPSDTALVIQQAAAEIMARGIAIPAMIELLMQGMVADFLDVLLPDAPQAYRDDVVKILMSGDEDEDEDSDDDDDESDVAAGQPQAS